MFDFFERNNLEFAQPYVLLLLLLVPLLIALMYVVHKKRRTSLTISTTQALQYLPVSWRTKGRFVVPMLQLLAFVFFIFGLARLQEVNVKEVIESEGVDIVLCMDISGSMLAEDFKPNRLEAAKKNAMDFVRDRPGDRFGLVIFGGESFTQCPITIDHKVVIQQLEKITNGLLEDGTAIGMGLSTGIDRLKDTKGKSKILILLTDGVNNTGKIDPSIALELAKTFGVKVYTIGIGTIGKALFPVQTPFGTQKKLVDVKIDEDLLRKISSETNGKYFRATNNQSLEAIYNEIDMLEKTKVSMETYKNHKERFHFFVGAGIFLLTLATVLQFTIFKKLP